MNIFWFWTATGTVYYVAAHSANEAFDILQRLGIDAKITDFSGEAAVISDSGEGLWLKATGYFRHISGPGEPIKGTVILYELVKDDGTIV